MLKVLIVDDEMLVRVGVKSTIQWEEHGCTVVAEAGNGEEALEKIETYQPDILLTDIRMPKMDGIELLRQIEKRGIHIETVIMSCYNEFELVREAMKLGASDYLLKLSLSDKELIEVLERIGRKIEKKIETHNLSDSGSFFSQSDLREKLFQKVTDPKVSAEQKRRLSENLNLCVTFEGAAFMLLVMDHVYLHERMGYEYQDEQSRNMTFNLLDDYLRGKKYGEIFWIDGQKGVLAVFLNQGLDLQGVAESIQRKINDYFKVSMSIYIFRDGMYEQCRDFIDFGLKSLLDDRYLDGKNGIYYHEPDCGKTEENQILKENRDSRLLSDVNVRQAGNGDSLEEWIKRQTEQMKGSRCSRKEYGRIFTETVYHEASAFHRVGGSLKDMEEKKGSELVKNLQELESLEDVGLWFGDFIKSAEAYMRECLEGQKRSEIEDAMRYIHENYHMPVSLKDAAEKAGLSAAYFSTVFKKENGSSFIEYLTDLRIENAKDLLADSKHCVYEVGEMVGYSDPNYFSKIFRKSAGVSPEKYRKQIREEN